MMGDGVSPLVELPTLRLPELSVRRWLPSPGLRPWVDLYWLAEGQQLSAVTAYGYADGGTTLRLDGLDSPRPAARWDGRPASAVHHFCVLHHAMGVRLRPGGAWQLASARRRGRDLLELLDAGPSWLDALSEQLAEYRGLYQRLQHLDDFLSRVARDNGAGIDTVQRVLPILVRQQGPVEDWQHQLGITRRGLERVFSRQVGMSPGQLALAWRLKTARQALAESAIPIVDIAMDTGFHDQAHFTHSFRRFVGETPGAYRRRKWSQIYNPD
ncbi:helix-turn-helix domain-containing protein [Halomonas cupida]|uniref:helix-turn-helix transcriptional regulator n=1 Tax=Halomonas cupida TaxID=44933 RepID=UPI003A8F518B